MHVPHKIQIRHTYLCGWILKISENVQGSHIFKATTCFQNRPVLWLAYFMHPLNCSSWISCSHLKQMTFSCWREYMKFFFWYAVIKDTHVVKHDLSTVQIIRGTFPACQGLTELLSGIIQSLLQLEEADDSGKSKSGWSHSSLLLQYVRTQSKQDPRL